MEFLTKFKIQLYRKSFGLFENKFHENFFASQKKKKAWKNRAYLANGNSEYKRSCSLMTIGYRTVYFHWSLVAIWLVFA